MVTVNVAVVYIAVSKTPFNMNEYVPVLVESVEEIDTWSGDVEKVNIVVSIAVPSPLVRVYVMELHVPSLTVKSVKVLA